HFTLRACSRAWAKTGKRIAVTIAMIAMTTSNSIRVNPGRVDPCSRAQDRCMSPSQTALRFAGLQPELGDGRDDGAGPCQVHPRRRSPSDRQATILQVYNVP